MVTGKSASRKSNKIFLFFTIAVTYASNKQKWNTIIWEPSPSKPSSFVEAFAGGGFGVSPKTKSKKKANKKKKKQENLSGIMETMTTKKKESEDSKKPKLDRFGLPIASIDNIFPTLPESTTIVPVDALNGNCTLSEIQDCLKDHVDLGDLTRVFDNEGLAKIPNQNGSIMRLRLLHRSPPVLTLDNFLTEDECQDIKKVAEKGSSTHRVGSATFKGALSTRTSTSWFCHYGDLPVLIAKAHHILGIPLETMEEPQIVRYKGGEEFSWHYDEVPPPQLPNGGQRVATLLVYLTDVPAWKGGGTAFRDLKESATSSSSLVMQPQMGSALLFFPSFADGSPDDRTLHKSEILKGDNTDDDHKWIVQMWTHQREYQASLPIGNSNKAARDIMADAGANLGYN